MKVAVLGAGGVRTPMLVRSFLLRQDRLGLRELALMDINGPRLDLMAALTAPLEAANPPRFKLTRTTDARAALAGADFVITTFRVGDMAARAVDERVALDLGVLGQETTGPGGYAMGLRTLPVLFEYLAVMREVCPDAWLLNFANPAGMLAQAIIHDGGWARAVGICDAPATMRRDAAQLLGVPADELFLDYFGLNHLGWARGVWHHGRDRLPELIDLLSRAGDRPEGFPIPASEIARIGMLPNEYLYYYYSADAVANLRRAGRTRGEQLLALNTQLYADLEAARAAEDFEAMQAIFARYHQARGESYFVAETGAQSPHDLSQLPPAVLAALGDEGYAGVALNVIAALAGTSGAPQTLVLNVANHGAVEGMRDEDVVETTCWVGEGLIRPLAVGPVPEHALKLMQQVKTYERLTIEAALTGSYRAALAALEQHPLVPTSELAKQLLDTYIVRHGVLMPRLV